MIPAPLPLPAGSDVAVAEGCVCPVAENRRGLGAYSDEFGHARFVVAAGCVLHGGAV